MNALISTGGPARKSGKGLERENGANPLQGRCCVRRQAVSQKTCLPSFCFGASATSIRQA
jgi:hypothetical protein